MALVRTRRLLQTAALALVLVMGRTAGISNAASTDFLMDIWTSDDDLPDSSVTSIAQTPDGYLWIGTMNGLARFDGVRFVHFDPFNTPALKHARVTGLFLDSRGTLWINTYDGSMTTFHNGVFTREWEGGKVEAIFSQPDYTYLALSRGQLACRSEPHNATNGWRLVNLIGSTTGTSFREDAQGRLWFFTRDGALGRVNGTNCQALPGDIGLRGTTVKDVAIDSGGRIWVGTEKEIARWDGQRFEDQTPTNGEPDLDVTFFFCPSSNDCWVVGNGKVRRCRDRQWIAEYPSWHELTSANPTYMDEQLDSRGRVWFRSYGLGLFYANPDGSARRLNSKNGLPNNQVSCWLEDHEGSIWLGVGRGGLVRLREKRIQVIGAADGVQVPAISTVCEDTGGNIWFGTFGGGLYCWREGALQSISPSDPTDLKSFFSIYPDARNRLWLSAGKEDLHRLENGRIHEMPDPTHGIKALLVDRHGRLWIGRQNGLACWSEGMLTNYTRLGEFERIDVRSIAEDRQGRLWFGTGNGRLWRFEDDHFTTYQPRDGLKNQAVWSLLPDDDGILWVGTFRGGLLRFKNGEFTRYTTTQGLPNNVICQLLEDEKGRLWIGSHKGIFHLPKAAFHELDQGRIETLPCVSYGMYDGLPTLECTGNYQPSCWQGRNGRLWFATVKGLVRVRPDEMSANPAPPPVVIEEIQLNGKPVNGRPAGNFAEANLEIPPGRHQLDFRYTALSFTAPDKVRFRYRLANFDNNWVEADSRRIAHYGPVPPGQYVFEVSACNNDGVWNLQGAGVGLEVLPQFWQTFWFQGLAAASLIGAIFATVRITATRRLHRKLELLKQQRAVERERERIAKDIHDDLGAGLTQILMQSSLARRESQGQVRTDLSQISDTARELVRAMDEIVWAINPENDTLDDLVTYIGKLVQEFVSSAGKRCRIIVPPQLPAHTVSAEARHNLFLAIKEALNNAAKHANATEISFQLNLQPSAVTFVIKDNGCGFNPNDVNGNATDGSRISSGHGLRNLAQRLEEIGGACAIRSTPGRGTSVELTLSLQKRMLAKT